HRGGEREVAVGEAMTSGEQHRAALEIKPLDAHVLAFARRRGDNDGVALAHRILLDHDRVGAGRQHAAREDARGFASPDRASKGATGRTCADSWELPRRPGAAARTRGGPARGGATGRRLGAQPRVAPGEHAALGPRPPAEVSAMDGYALRSADVARVPVK